MKHAQKKQRQHPQPGSAQPQALPTTSRTPEDLSVYDEAIAILCAQPDYIAARQLTAAVWFGGMSGLGAITLSGLALFLAERHPQAWQAWMRAPLLGGIGVCALLVCAAWLRYRRIRATLPRKLPDAIRNYQRAQHYKSLGFAIPMLGLSLFILSSVLTENSGLPDRDESLWAIIITFVFMISVGIGVYFFKKHVTQLRQLSRPWYVKLIETRQTVVNSRRKAMFAQEPGWPKMIWRATDLELQVRVKFPEKSRLFGLAYNRTRMPICVTATELIFPEGFMGVMRDQPRPPFALAQIQNIRLVGAPHQKYVALRFDYIGQNILTLPALNHADARQLVAWLTELLTFRQQSVECLLFGNLPVREAEAPRTLRNPDVTTATLPFRRLRQIVIDADSYDFYQLERFVTYAVNVIGEDYLKEQVDVEIHGNADRLHPNLRNVLTNLCRRVEYAQN